MAGGDAVFPGVAAAALISRIEILAYQTSFDVEKHAGSVPVSVSIIGLSDLQRAVKIMGKVFGSAFCFSDLVAVAHGGEKIGEVPVPEGAVGMATISNIIVKGVLLKAGIPAVPRFAGILEIKNRRAVRFVDLVEYGSTSLDPSEIFVAGKMTAVSDTVRRRSGRIMANFWEIPALARIEAEEIINRLRSWHVAGLVLFGRVSVPVCEIPVAAYRVGMVVADGLNPVAALAEAGIETVNHTMSGLVDVGKMAGFRSLYHV